MAASHHMQMSADVKVNAGMNNMQMRQQQQMVQQQQQTMFYNQTAAGQQPTATQPQAQQQPQQPQQQQQQQPAMDSSYTYSASQTQTINFTQQHLRANTRMPASLGVQQQAAQQQQQAMQQQQQQQVKPLRLWSVLSIFNVPVFYCRPWCGCRWCSSNNNTSSREWHVRHHPITKRRWWRPELRQQELLCPTSPTSWWVNTWEWWRPINNNRADTHRLLGLVSDHRWFPLSR